jgi:hypothetical protein
MQRENFYALLELSIDPPEDNPEVIESAIKKKQAEWSRNRNHPTKGLQAKQSIGMLPEIRKVMSDPTLRAKEALAAQKVFQKREADKFAEIDRHLQLRMSKGFITDEDVEKLAKLHGIDQQVIRTRVGRMEAQKFAEIDKHLNIRLTKGYITEDEITKLAKLHGLSTSKIRPRIKGPIRKEARGGPGETVEILDKSVDKLIRDNLAILGKNSLYQFLDLPPNSDLASLQRRTQEKEGELLKVGKKDALVTAGGVLVGHCITIFQSEESRHAYDISRAQASLAKLHGDIDAAGLDGAIRAEYFEPLIRSAMEFGMDRDEAAQYIQNYCAKKNWKIALPAAPKTVPAARRPLAWRNAALTAGATLALIALALGWYFFAGSTRNDYRRTMAAVENEASLENKIALLQDFTRKHPQGEYPDQALAKMEALQQALGQRQFNQVTMRAKALADAGQIAEALAALEEHAAKNPSGSIHQRLRQQIAALQSQAEARDYQALMEAMRGLAPDRLDRYLAYLEQHPRGPHREEVRKLLSDMEPEVMLAFKRDHAALTADERWEAAIQLAEKVLAAYPEGKANFELREALGASRKSLTEKKIFDNLVATAERHGSDHAAAVKVFKDFLAAYPQAAIRERVKGELAKRETLVRQAKLDTAYRQAAAALESTAGRFSVKGEGMVVDSRTGLVWTLVDSAVEVDGCLDYGAAQRYVKELRTGGHRDWRLPSSEELAGLYLKPPPLPAEAGSWYWSSHSYSHYAERNAVKIVDVLANSPGGWQHAKKDSRDCGALRAVRP